MTPVPPLRTSSREGYRSAKTRHVLSPHRATGRFFLATLLGLAAMLLTPHTPELIVRAVVGWDVTALSWLMQCWAMFRKSDATQTELRAGDEDPGGAAVFVVAVLSSFFSLFVATVVLRQLRAHSNDEVWVGLALLSVALSWLVTHTAYTLRYAHLYYRPPTNGGLLFPGEQPPTDLDFAYYAFTVGMCFQVSDVQITSREIRISTLGQALISFVFNTTIVALALNLILQVLGE
jgi:uncharacterized membrane protein